MEGAERDSPEYLQLLGEAKIEKMMLQQATNNKLRTLETML